MALVVEKHLHLRYKQRINNKQLKNRYMKKELVDLRVNGKCDLHKLHKSDKGKVTRRINSNTIILVPESRNTDEYVKFYRERMNKL